jgi:hypothetical protein
MHAFSVAAIGEMKPPRLLSSDRGRKNDIVLLDAPDAEAPYKPMDSHALLSWKSRHKLTLDLEKLIYIDFTSFFTFAKKYI